MIKPEKEVLLGVKLPNSLKNQLYRYCKERGVKMKYFVREAIRDKLTEANPETMVHDTAAEYGFGMAKAGPSALKALLKERARDARK